MRWPWNFPHDDTGETATGVPSSPREALPEPAPPGPPDISGGGSLGTIDPSSLDPTSVWNMSVAQALSATLDILNNDVALESTERYILRLAVKVIHHFGVEVTDEDIVFRVALARIEIADPASGQLVRTVTLASASAPGAGESAQDDAPRKSSITGIAARAMRQRTTQIVADVELDKDYDLGPLLEEMSLLAVPITVEGECVGVLTIGAPTLGEFSAEQVYYAETAAALVALAETADRARGQPRSEELRMAIGAALEQRRDAAMGYHSSPDRDMQVTVFHAKAVPVDSWSTMLVYSHIEAALIAVRMDALKFPDHFGPDPRVVSGGASGVVAWGTEITMVPSLDGVQFDPDEVSVRWTEEWHRALFRFRPAHGVAGSAGNGEVRVYATTGAGRLLIATVKLAMLFEEAVASSPLASDARTHLATQTSEYLYKRLFASYSHQDLGVVQACTDAYQALGITVLIDQKVLHSGEYFGRHLKWLIESSDVFQLYWSHHAAASEWVRRESEHALTCNRGEGFIRPLYWEEPMRPPPPELAHLHFARLELAAALVSAHRPNEPC